MIAERAEQAEIAAAVAGRSNYRGRFAPSPTGLLHAGSMVAALASWLDARAHGGAWLVRIEDVDGVRCSADTARSMLSQLAACHLFPDEPPLWQSSRSDAYARALDRLRAAGLAYPCTCSRSDIEAAGRALGRSHVPGADRIYPGTCRDLAEVDTTGAWRFKAGGTVQWHDRRLGDRQQDLGREVGDFLLRRADGYWAYQLAVVVDDADQGITHVVRGEDLADNTARQIGLQRALGLPQPAYLHTPLVLAPDGRKLSKQNAARPIDAGQPLAAVQAAGRALGLPIVEAVSVAGWLSAAVPAWAGIIAGFATGQPR